MAKRSSDHAGDNAPQPADAYQPGALLRALRAPSPPLATPVSAEQVRRDAEAFHKHFRVTEGKQRGTPEPLVDESQLVEFDHQEPSGERIIRIVFRLYESVGVHEDPALDLARRMTGPAGLSVFCRYVASNLLQWAASDTLIQHNVENSGLLGQLVKAIWDHMFRMPGSDKPDYPGEPYTVSSVSKSMYDVAKWVEKNASASGEKPEIQRDHPKAAPPAGDEGGDPKLGAESDDATQGRNRDAATNKARKWMYDEAMKGTPWNTIRLKLNKKPNTWPRYESIQGVKGAVKQYAKEKNNPDPPIRQPGREKK